MEFDGLIPVARFEMEVGFLVAYGLDHRGRLAKATRGASGKD
jgi:hypothetical protein